MPVRYRIQNTNKIIKSIIAELGCPITFSARIETDCQEEPQETEEVRCVRKYFLKIKT